MKVLGIDFETQCDNAAETRITEIGAILVDFSTTPDLSNSPRFRTLCYEPDYPPQTDKIVELTGITDATLKEEGRPRREVWPALLGFVQNADIIVAHNKKFDQMVFDSTSKVLGFQPSDKRWLCTWSEVNYPDRFTCKKLSHLAWEHDIEVDRSKLHRADYDVELMLKLLVKYDLNEVLSYANEPWVYIQAIIPAPWQDNGVGKEKASKLGYSWERARGDDKTFSKSWIKRVKTRFVDDEKKKAANIEMMVRVISN